MSIYTCTRCHQDKQDDDSPLQLFQLTPDTEEIVLCWECHEELMTEREEQEGK